MRKTRKVVSIGAAALLASATLAACGNAPDEKKGGEAASDFLPCIVSDFGGFDDKSFNQLSYEGVQKAADELGVKAKAVESKSASDYQPNIDSLVSEGCDIIVAVGFELASATKEAAKANPDLEFALIDDIADGGDDGKTFDGKTDVANIKPLIYNTAEAAFMAGYAAADYSKTGKVGTYGGLPLPTVTIFMDGFKQGVEYYNKEKGKNVEVVGWDGKNGSFTGGFEAGPTATETARQVLNKDVDVILPVGGPIYEGAMTAIEDANSDAVMIGTDADVFETDPRTQDIIFTSIMKGMDVAAYEAVMAAGEDKFSFEPFIGTLENGGVGLAPFHNFEDKVSPELQGELDDIKAGIIDGSIEVTSYLD